MEYVLCYDISDDRRRDRVATALLDYGRRIQESVFLASLDEELVGLMRVRVMKLLDVENDSFYVFPMCSSCRGKAESHGAVTLPRDQDFYIL